jgi:hypothetical protein
MHHVNDAQYCCITLEPLESLRYPVVFRGDTHIFELMPLLTWLSKNPTHPISRKQVAIHEGFLEPLAQGQGGAVALRHIQRFVDKQQSGKWAQN